MRTKKLGTSGPDISVVGYGAWELGGAWGTNPSDDEMIGAMHAAFDAGVTWVDTAEVYGKAHSSEKLVARAHAGRNDVLVFTKVAPKPVGSGFAPEQVRAAAEGSLKRLGRIDLYQLHWRDNDVPVEETWGSMVSLVEDGLVRFIGVSNFDVDLLERCRKIRHVDSLQPEYSMLARAPEEDVLPWCERNGTGVIAYGPLAYGLLTGTIDAGTTFEGNDWRAGTMGMGAYERLFKPGAREGKLAVVDALRPIADRLEVSLAQLALAWVFHQPGATAAIAGSRRAAHTVENARAGDVALTEKDVDEIAAVLS